ncbi:MAG: hypothetical protein ACREL3_07535 [Gemmatimonadales bacterium]
MQLHFRMYVPDAEPRWHTPDSPVGGSIPDKAYWHLSGTDYQGRDWRCDRVLVNPGWSQPGRGSILGARLPLLQGREELDEPVEGGSFTGFVFHDLRLPANRRTHIRTERDTEWSESGSWDTAVAQLQGVRFLFHQDEEEQFRVSAWHPSDPLHPYFAERVREALQFIAAFPVSWAVTDESAGTERKTYIRGRPSPRFAPRIQRPIPGNVAYSEIPTWRLFESYLAFVSKDTTSEIHRISAEWGEVLRSSIGTVETEALISAITVESLCRYLQELRPGLSYAGAPEAGGWGDRVDTFLRVAGASERLRRRVRGVFNKMIRSDHTDVLIELQSAGAIEARLVEAWNRWRPIMAHGDREAQAKSEELSRGTNAVVTLLYQLYFHVIGYAGLYTDFSQVPWRGRSYPPGSVLTDLRSS